MKLPTWKWKQFLKNYPGPLYQYEQSILTHIYYFSTDFITYANNYSKRAWRRQFWIFKNAIACIFTHPLGIITLGPYEDIWIMKKRCTPFPPVRLYTENSSWLYSLLFLHFILSYFFIFFVFCRGSFFVAFMTKMIKLSLLKI